MSDPGQLARALERSLHNVIVAAAPCVERTAHARLLGEVHSALAGLDAAGRGHAPLADAVEHARRTLADLQPLVPRGGRAAQEVALARWLCDAMGQSA